MKILWIEDNYSEDLQAKFFGNLHNSYQLLNHDDYEEAHNLIENGIHSFDYVVIDIDLAINEISGLTKEYLGRYSKTIGDFEKEAGFHLFLLLYKNSFPVKRIVFLTGNTFTSKRDKLAHQAIKAIEMGDFEKIDHINQNINDEIDSPTQQKLQGLITNEDIPGIKEFYENLKSNAKNTYQVFEDRFREARIIPPVDFSKNEDPKLFHKWLDDNLNRSLHNENIFDYLLLRRSIFDMIKKVEKQNITKEFKDLNKEHYLYGMEWLLKPNGINPEYETEFYLTLCDYFTKPFDKFKYSELKTQEPKKRSSLMPAYFLRNWIAHRVLSKSKTSFTAQEAGFTMLICMHSIFGISDSISEDLCMLFHSKISFNSRFLINQVITLHNKIYKHSNKSDVLDELNSIGNIKASHKDDYRLHYYSSYIFASNKLANNICEEDSLENNKYTLSSQYEIEKTPYLDIAAGQLQKYLSEST
jgi:hypothetical protein